MATEDERRRNHLRALAQWGPTRVRVRNDHQVITPAQARAMDDLRSELDDLEWAMDDDDVLYAGNSADGPVLGTITPTGEVIPYA